ncbi:MAG: helix-turn-helix domain-containing protein [Candidatus Dormiibacterota bacterium]
MAPDNSRTIEELPEFLTRAEAAAQLRIGRALLDRMISSGELRALRVHRRVLIPVASIRELACRSRPR